MKAIKTLCIALLALTMSCSSDDDTNTPNVETGFFPKKITKTSVTDPTVNRSFNYTYNTDNQISNISIVLPGGEVFRNYNLSYNNGLLTQLDAETIVYSYGYTIEGILSNITLMFGTELVILSVNHDQTAHSYSFTLEGTTTVTLNSDETFMLMYENDSPSNTTIGYTTIDGVFTDVAPQVALQLTLAGFQGLDYLFFHPFQVQGFIHNGTEWTLTNTRDDNENIVTVVASSPFESYTYTIEYEQRELHNL